MPPEEQLPSAPRKPRWGLVNVDPIPSPANPSPSLQAKIGFWAGLMNSAGLMALGVYCSKAAIDDAHGPAAALVLANSDLGVLAAFLGLAGLVAQLAWRR